MCYIAVVEKENYYDRHRFAGRIAVNGSLTSLLEFIYNLAFLTFSYAFNYLILHEEMNSPDRIDPS